MALHGCSSDAPGGHDAALPPADGAHDASAQDSGALDAAPADGGRADAALGEDGGGSACGGACGLGQRDSCTCQAIDPCGWRANGVCDDACRGVLPGGHFDDLADCDADLDGLYDGLEDELAARFEPYLWLSSREDGYRDDRLPHYAVEPIAGPGISIFYALSYFEDYGDPDLGGLSGHLGDSEFVVVELSSTGPLPGDGPWQLHRVFLSAHYGTVTSGSGWFQPPDIQLTADATGTEHPVVYVSEWKHANYRSLQTCDNGAFFTDHCEEFLLERVGIAPGRNLGNDLVPLLDDVPLGGNHEFYWTDVRFCGWRVASVSNADRGDCPGQDSTYADFLSLWLTGSL